MNGEQKKVREMMIHKEDLVGRQIEFADEDAFDPQLLVEPGNHGLTKDDVGAGHGLQDAEEDALEFGQRLFIENNVIEISGRDAGRAQAELDRLRGKAKVVFDAREALFLGRGHQVTVVQQRGRGIMIETRNTKYVHALFGLFRFDLI